MASQERGVQALLFELDQLDRIFQLSGRVRAQVRERAARQLRGAVHQRRPREAREPAARAVPRARLLTGVGYRLLASANFGQLVLFCIEADFCVQILIKLFCRIFRDLQE